MNRRLVLAEDSFLMGEGISALLTLDEDLELVEGCQSYDELLHDLHRSSFAPILTTYNAGEGRCREPSDSLPDLSPAGDR